MRLPLHPERLSPGWQDEVGLSTSEAEAQRRRFGPNDVLEPTRSAWRQLVLDTVRDPMIAFMVATSALYFVLGETAEGTILLISTVPLMAMDAFLHRRAQASMEALRERLAATATVLRDGGWRTVPAHDLVVGDLVEVRAPNNVPADGLVVRSEGAQCDESSLTGESEPVRKRAVQSLPDGGEVPDGAHWAMAGTRLLTGAVRVRVQAVGAETLYGGLARFAQTTRHTRTPLQAAVARLVLALIAASALLCAALAYVRWRQGFGWVDALVSAATLAVAALPEEFPVALTFFLGVGVFRLARRKAMVRRAVSVENIGRITCICSDKTGTITEGRLEAVAALPSPGVARADLLLAARSASRPEAGDPLDVALTHLATREGVGTGPERLATFPFTEQRRIESALFEEQGKLRWVVKGAPERVIARCHLSPDEASWTQATLAEQTTLGRKVIACAEAWLPRAGWNGEEPDAPLRLLGLVALEDPVREGVREAVASCAAAGIRTLLVTGDHLETARAVSRSIGLGSGEPRLVTGEDLAGLPSLEEVDGIARALPADKLALIQRLQAAGEHVAVTGDGVNDVPALEAADVGIAMGERGTRSAKDAAAIVLLNDDFGTIVSAVAEGRQLFQNLRASFAYLVMIHTPLVLTAALLPLAGYPLVFLPIHVVWLELVIHPTAMLVFQAPAHEGTLERLPHFGRARFFSRLEAFGLGLSGLAAFGLIVAGYRRSLGAQYAVEHARALVMAFLVLVSILSSSLLSRWRTVASRIVPAAALGISVILLQTPLAGLLDLAPLHWDDWLFAAAGAGIAAVPVALLSLRRDRIGASRSPHAHAPLARR